MDSPGRKCMRPIPIAQYLNQFGRASSRRRADRVHRDSVLLRPRVLSTPADIEARIEEAYGRAAKHGRSGRRARGMRPRPCLWSRRDSGGAARTRGGLPGRRMNMRNSPRKSKRAMAAIEDRLAQSVARILKPFLIEERVKHITDALSENLSKILSRETRRRAEDHRARSAAERLARQVVVAIR